MKEWFVYLVECIDGTFYTGVTDDVELRLKAHNSGKGAKYTRGRRPVVLRYLERVSEKGEALKREAEIKRMRKKQKISLMVEYCQRDL